jgi:hypothetical protein
MYSLYNYYMLVNLLILKTKKKKKNGQKTWTDMSKQNIRVGNKHTKKCSQLLVMKRDGKLLEMMVVMTAWQDSVNVLNATTKYTQKSVQW